MLFMNLNTCFDMKTPRGIINNNPANIRRGSAWKGLVPFLVNPQNKQRVCDKSFCQFSSLEYGIRALIVLLRTYCYKYNLCTIEKIIHRFAPLSENNTYAYIENVVRHCQRLYREDFENKLPDYLNSPTFIVYPLQGDELRLFRNPKEPSFDCRCLMKAICKQETGFDLTDELIDTAITLL